MLRPVRLLYIALTVVGLMIAWAPTEAVAQRPDSTTGSVSQQPDERVGAPSRRNAVDTSAAGASQRVNAPSWLERHRRWLLGVLGAILLSIPGSLWTPLGAKVKREFKEWRNTQKQDVVHIWNLIPSRTPEKGRAVALLKAINRGAAIREQEELSSPKLKQRSQSKAARLWDPLFEDRWVAERTFAPPGCHVTERGQKPRPGDGLAAIRGWLEQCQPGSTTEDWVGRISVSGFAGTGKTTFMQRLFLDLVRDRDAGQKSSTPVPMLASARNLRYENEKIEQLRLAPPSRVVHEFVDAWLNIRKIEVPDRVRESLIRDFCVGLEGGEIVLLLDGVDELRHHDLTKFTKNLQANVKFWVVSHRPGEQVANSARAITLDESWTSSQLRRHLDERWPDSPESRALVERALVDVLDRHDESTANTSKRHRFHWLRNARNLDFFLRDVARGDLPSEREIRNRAENQTYLFHDILSRAIKRIDASEHFAAIRDRLFEVAAADPTNARRKTERHTVRLDDATGQQVASLTELLGSADNGVLYFKHAALREYFIAGRIAWELRDTVREPEKSDELLRNDAWSAAKRAAVVSWLYDPNELETDARELLRNRLRKAGGPRLMPGMLRNLLDLLIRLELDHDEDRRKIVLADLDLSELAGPQLDLRLMTVRNTTFENAELEGAELSHAKFFGCDFSRADLSRAEAVGALFEDCSFGTIQHEMVNPNQQSEGETLGLPSDSRAKVKRMVIEGAEFRKDGADASSQCATLVEREASRIRSRYGAGFGRLFLADPKVFLGEGAEQLEKNAYLPAIERAVDRWHDDSREIVYLVDLMAGGSYERVAELRRKFERLHILGIDRDNSTQSLDSQFRWVAVEIGNGSERVPELGVDVPASLKDAFRDEAALPSVIVAKKALHELDYDLQPILIRRCADWLRPGGSLILFEDVPGPSEGVMDDDALDGIHSELDTLRRILLDSDCEPADVSSALAARKYDASPAGKVRFANSWIMLKDWVNYNLHEVRHRYFASVAEILAWGKEGFGPPSVTSNHYRLNPLMFNELGIQRVLHHLEREGGDPAEVIERDEQQLREAIWPTRQGDAASPESERLQVLIDFTRKSLAPGSPLAQELNAREEAIDLRKIDKAWARLNTGETATEFDLPCAVLVFEKRAG